MKTRVLISGAALFSALVLPMTASAQWTGLPVNFETDCAETFLDGECHLVASAKSFQEDVPAVAIQIQSGFSQEDGVGGGVVIYQDLGSGWEKLASDFAGYTYHLPTFAQMDEGMIMHIAGARPGTGSGNADIAFFAPWSDAGDTPSGWRQIDITSWKDTIGDHLPEGLEIWHGVDFDLGDWLWIDLTAKTYLWKADTDGGCCPTGGRALIHFDLKDDALVVRKVDYDPTPASD